MFDFDIARIILGIPAMIIAIVALEYGEARAAVWLGDPMPKAYNRLTLNPLAHLDPIGAIALVLAGLGWAKPMPVNVSNFKDPKRDQMLLAFAGPVTCLIVAFIVFFGLSLALAMDIPMSKSTYTMIYLIIAYNIGLAIFNLIPIPPLPGGRLLTVFLPWEWRMKLENFSWGTFIVLLIVINTPIFSYIFRPLQMTILKAFQWVVDAIL